MPGPAAQAAALTTTPRTVLSTRPATAVTVATRARSVATPVAAGTAARTTSTRRATGGDGGRRLRQHVAGGAGERRRRHEHERERRLRRRRRTRRRPPPRPPRRAARVGPVATRSARYNATGSANTGGNDDGCLRWRHRRHEHGRCVRERRRSDRRHGQRERRGGHGWRLGGQQHVGRDPELDAGHDPVVELAEVVVGLSIDDHSINDSFNRKKIHRGCCW